MTMLNYSNQADRISKNSAQSKLEGLTVSRLLTIVLFVFITSCAVFAQTTWIRNMWVGPVVIPQTEIRMPPEHVIAVDGQRIMSRRDARLSLKSPLTETDEVISQGSRLYEIYCALCHGTTGMGDGQLASFYRRIPNLTLRYVLNYPEGFVYSVIREGGRNMPGFADALKVDERWALVHYLRTLKPAVATE